MNFYSRNKFQNLFLAAVAALPLAVVVGQVPVPPPPAPQKVTEVPVTPAPVAVPAPVPPPGPVVSTAALTNLVFDAETKEYKARLGEATASFTFHVTNISDVPVHVVAVKASCGCTVPQLPRIPWVIEPGKSDDLTATMALAGKPPGNNTKTLTIQSTNGTKQLYVTSIIPAPTVGMTEADRQKNLELAKADSQAIFKNDCAKCHVDKSKGLVGAPLYKEACGICHDSDHRATSVPDLHALNHPTDTAFWTTMVTNGKDKTLMPAFSQEHGGPLSKDQIDSLVTYLTTDFAKEKSVPQIKLPAAAPASTNQSPRAMLPAASSMAS